MVGNIQKALFKEVFQSQLDSLKVQEKKSPDHIMKNAGIYLLYEFMQEHLMKNDSEVAKDKSEMIQTDLDEVKSFGSKLTVEQKKWEDLLSSSDSKKVEITSKKADLKKEEAKLKKDVAKDKNATACTGSTGGGNTSVSKAVTDDKKKIKATKKTIKDDYTAISDNLKTIKNENTKYQEINNEREKAVQQAHTDKTVFLVPGMQKLAMDQSLARGAIKMQEGAVLAILREMKHKKYK
jgi:hypothetical protein